MINYGNSPHNTSQENEKNKGYVLEIIKDQSILVTMEKNDNEDDDNKVADNDTICCRINFACEGGCLRHISNRSSFVFIYLVIYFFNHAHASYMHITHTFFTRALYKYVR